MGAKQDAGHLGNLHAFFLKEFFYKTYFQKPAS